MPSGLDERPVDPAEAADGGTRSTVFGAPMDGGGTTGLGRGGGPSSDVTPVGARNSAFSSRCAAAIPSLGDGRGASANEGGVC